MRCCVYYLIKLECSVMKYYTIILHQPIWKVWLYFTDACHEDLEVFRSEHCVQVNAECGREEVWIRTFSALVLSERWLHAAVDLPWTKEPPVYCREAVQDGRISVTSGTRTRLSSPKHGYCTDWATLPSVSQTAYQEFRICIWFLAYGSVACRELKLN